MGPGAGGLAGQAAAHRRARHRRQLARRAGARLCRAPAARIEADGRGREQARREPDDRHRRGQERAGRRLHAAAHLDRAGARAAAVPAHPLRPLCRVHPAVAGRGHLHLPGGADLAGRVDLGRVHRAGEEDESAADGGLARPRQRRAFLHRAAVAVAGRAADPRGLPRRGAAATRPAVGAHQRRLDFRQPGDAVRAGRQGQGAGRGQHEAARGLDAAGADLRRAGCAGPGHRGLHRPVRAVADAAADRRTAGDRTAPHRRAGRRAPRAVHLRHGARHHHHPRAVRGGDARYLRRLGAGHPQGQHQAGVRRRAGSARARRPGLIRPGCSRP